MNTEKIIHSQLDPMDPCMEPKRTKKLLTTELIPAQGTDQVSFGMREEEIVENLEIAPRVLKNTWQKEVDLPNGFTIKGIPGVVQAEFEVSSNTCIGICFFADACDVRFRGYQLSTMTGEELLQLFRKLDPDQTVEFFDANEDQVMITAPTFDIMISTSAQMGKTICITQRGKNQECRQLVS